MAGGGLLPADDRPIAGAAGDSAAVAGAADVNSIAPVGGRRHGRHGRGMMPAGAWARRPWSASCRRRRAGPARSPRCQDTCCDAAHRRGLDRRGAASRRAGGIMPGMPGMAGAGRSSVRASVRRATASSPSSCRSRRPSRQRGTNAVTRTQLRSEIRYTRGTDTEMVLDFAALPPEINSALMYTGAGSGPLMAAAAAWSNLAAELSTTATSWESIITTLTTEAVDGCGVDSGGGRSPALCGLADVPRRRRSSRRQPRRRRRRPPMRRRSRRTVPPAVIAANRALLSALVATNFLGINTPAIAATEAQYAEMWVQDATAMYTYQAASTAAAALQPLTPASPTASPAAAAIQSAAAQHCLRPAPLATAQHHSPRCRRMCRIADHAGRLRRHLVQLQLRSADRCHRGMVHR